MTGARTPGHLLALTPGEAQGPGDVRALVRTVAIALEAGLPAVLLREPRLCDRDLLQLVRETIGLRERLGGGWVGVHDAVHVALAGGADGVHLGFRSLPLAEARPLVEGRCALGFSAHEEDERETWQLADYLCFGPVRRTPSKEGVLEPTGFEALGRAAAAASGPVLALGGMRPEDSGAARSAGAAGVAVLSGILGAPDPAARTRAYLEALDPEAAR